MSDLQQAILNNGENKMSMTRKHAKMVHLHAALIDRCFVGRGFMRMSDHLKGGFVLRREELKYCLILKHNGRYDPCVNLKNVVTFKKTQT